MRITMKCHFLSCVFALLLLSTAYAAEFRVPLFGRAPVIDGKIEAAEWQGAAQFEGFIVAGQDQLERRRVRCWVGANATTIYVAIASQLPDEGELLATVKQDSLKAVYDDAVEVFVNPTPGAQDHVDYQMLANCLGHGGYNIHKAGTPEESEAWQGDGGSRARWRMAGGNSNARSPLPA